MDRVTLTIDGKAITVEKGRTVLQAAIEHGIEIPYYCYHPALGVDGSCRVCIVKIEKMPKLQTACSTICAEGMVIDTQTPDVVQARASVFEFLLINHPLDCPVCDKGGECPLQDFSYTFGPAGSRMEFPRRVFDGEGVRADVDFGPRLMLNRNRCILCTRCIRFMRQIDGDAQIGIVSRGYGSEIATFSDLGVRSLISGNLVDVCPVGAITAKDYRFKSRPWDNQDAEDTICTLCSKGCSITAWLKAKPEWARGARLVRITPRFNPDVNGYWMCDAGRFDYQWIEGDDRIRRPLVRGRGRVLQPAPWHDLLGSLGGSLARAGDRLAFVLSAHASVEEMFLARRLVDAPGGAATDSAAARLAVSWRCQPKPQPEATAFRIPAVDAPNVRGARDLGLQAGAANADQPDLSALRSAVERGHVAALYVLDPGPAGSIGDLSWVVDARRVGRLPLLVVQGVLMTEVAQVADFVLPGACYLEKDGCYRNDQGRVQAAFRILPPPGEAMEDWRALLEVADALGQPVAYSTLAEVRDAVGTAMAGEPAYAALNHLAAVRRGPAKHWLQSSNPSERGKWDALFRDLPPVKGTVDPRALETVIMMKKVD